MLEMSRMARQTSAVIVAMPMTINIAFWACGCTTVACPTHPVSNPTRISVTPPRWPAAAQGCLQARD